MKSEVGMAIFCIDASEKEDFANWKKEHDAELLDKVMQKKRTIIDEDGVMYKVVFLKDIEKLKAEVQKGAE